MGVVLTVDAEGAPVDVRGMTSVLEAVAAERVRQVVEHGYTPEHDDEHDRGLLRALALRKITAAAGAQSTEGRQDRLIKAAALLVAEIERLDRLTG